MEYLSVSVHEKIFINLVASLTEASHSYVFHFLMKNSVNIKADIRQKQRILLVNNSQ